MCTIPCVFDCRQYTNLLIDTFYSSTVILCEGPSGSHVNMAPASLHTDLEPTRKDGQPFEWDMCRVQYGVSTANAALVFITGATAERGSHQMASQNSLLFPIGNTTHTHKRTTAHYEWDRVFFKKRLSILRASPIKGISRCSADKSLLKTQISNNNKNDVIKDDAFGTTA